MSLFDKITALFKNRKSNDDLDNKYRFHAYVGKFVKQNNNDIGESIAIEKGRIIVKNNEGLLSIPVEAVLNNTEYIFLGDFNKEESLELGKEWSLKKDIMNFDKNGMLIK